MSVYGHCSTLGMYGLSNLSLGMGNKKHNVQMLILKREQGTAELGANTVLKQTIEQFLWISTTFGFQKVMESSGNSGNANI